MPNWDIRECIQFPVVWYVNPKVFIAVALYDLTSGMNGCVSSPLRMSLTISVRTGPGHKHWTVIPLSLYS